MGMEKRTKIILFVIITLLVIGGIVGILLGLLLHRRYVYLEVHPRSEDYYANWDQPVIEFRTQDPGSWGPWVRRINDFLREYETTVPEDPPRAPCSTQASKHAVGINQYPDQYGMRSDIAVRSDYGGGRSDYGMGADYNMRSEFGMRSDMCDIAMRMWGPCTIDANYGYPYGKPCVFLRLTHVHYWVPHPYNISYPLSMPMDMPVYLQERMRQYPVERYGDFVWVSCDGEYGADQENIGPIQYYPASPGGYPAPSGFPTKQLQTANRIEWANRGLPDQVPPPLVAVQFEMPRRGVLINVECRIWSRDIYYDRTSRVGRARFELYVQ